MTINVKTLRTHPDLLVFHTEHAGLKGYTFRFEAKDVFVPEAEADALARYMLFKPPAADAVG